MAYVPLLRTRVYLCLEIHSFCSPRLLVVPRSLPVAMEDSMEYPGHRLVGREVHEIVEVEMIVAFASAVQKGPDLLSQIGEIVKSVAPSCHLSFVILTCLSTQIADFEISQCKECPPTKLPKYLPLPRFRPWFTHIVPCPRSIGAFKHNSLSAGKLPTLVKQVIDEVSPTHRPESNQQHNTSQQHCTTIHNNNLQSHSTTLC